MSEDSRAEQPQRPQTFSAVGLNDASLDQVHDGFALASFLRVAGVACQVRRFGGDAANTAVARELLEASEQLVFLAVGPHNLQRVIRVAGLLEGQRVICLFGRELMDPLLREQVAYPPVKCVIVGEPHVPARDLARKMLEHPDAGGDFCIAGTYRPDHPYSPVSPLRDLNVIPPGDLGYYDDLVARAVPLHGSRGYPRAVVYSARRQWEIPTRRQRPERIVHDLELYSRDFGARHFIFLDMAVNTDVDALRAVAHGVLEKGLKVFWHATVWPDAALDRGTLHLLAHSGCRTLDVEFSTASTELARALQTGVDPEVVAQLLQHCAMEGIAARPRLLVGAPGETDEDRQATHSWLARHAAVVDSVASLECCTIRHGAPLFWHKDLAVPRDTDGDQWHDGGENNQSKRSIWQRELALWIDRLGIRRSAGPLVGSGETRGEACERIARQVADSVGSEVSWKRRRLLYSGIIHGREAFCGPETLHLDLVGMDPALATRLIAEAAQMGTRELVLGRTGGLDSAEAEDVLAVETLQEVLEAARGAGLRIVLRVALETEGIDADQLRGAAAGVQELELEAYSAAQWEALERWLPVVAQQRSDTLLTGPRITLRAWIGSESEPLDALVQRAARLGVDRLALPLVRREEGRLDGVQRAAAAQALQQLLEQRYGAPAQLPETADHDHWRQPDRGGTLLALDSGWPPGFRLSPGAARWAASCPAQKQTHRLSQHPCDPTAVQADFAEPACVACEMLHGCSVHRLDFSVRLPLLLLEAPERLAADLDDEDCGLGRAAAAIDSEPCLVGWTEAHVDAGGQLYVCAECGADAVGSVADQPLASIWYSRELNEFRRMTQGASLALPYVDRRRCGMSCPRLGCNQQLWARITRLPVAQREILEQAGAGDRLQPAE